MEDWNSGTLEHRNIRQLAHWNSGTSRTGAKADGDGETRRESTKGSEQKDGRIKKEVREDKGGSGEQDDVGKDREKRLEEKRTYLACVRWREQDRMWALERKR